MRILTLTLALLAFGCSTPPPAKLAPSKAPQLVVPAPVAPAIGTIQWQLGRVP